MVKHIFAFFWGTISLFFLFSCSTNNQFTMGEELVNVKTNIVSVDTSTIWCSTVKRDSVASSGFGVALVGNYKDEETDLGIITASSYFEMALPASTSIDTSNNVTVAFDSITLSLKYSHYYYGDTTQPLKIEAYRLDENFKDKQDVNGYLYNTQTIKYSAFLGSKTLQPMPLKRDSIEIRLSDDFGNDLLNKAKKQSVEISTNDEFLKYFKGFVLTASNTTMPNVILGFKTDTVNMRLYYRIIEQGKTKGVKYNLNFGINTITQNSTSVSAQFNHIEVNRGSSNLNDLKKLENSVYSTRTKNQTYCQAGIGLMTKLEFPYLKQLLPAESNVKILKAVLILCPVKQTYKLVSLPKSLYFSSTDNLNTFTNAFFTNSQGAVITPTLYIDEQYNEATQYSLDMTSFVVSAANASTNNIPAVEVSISSDKNYNSLSRVVLGDAFRTVNTAKLEILYWRY